MSTPPSSPSSSPAVARIRSLRRPTLVGEVNWTVLLWAIGVPLPLVLIVGLIRGCG